MRLIKRTSLTCGLALLAVAVVGCQKDKKKKSNPVVVPAVDTWVVETEEEEGSVKFRYNSNVTDARYKCQTEVDGTAGEWSECPTSGFTLTVEPGTKYTFKVKAFTTDGREDSEPYAYTFTSKASSPEAPTQPNPEPAPQPQEPEEGALNGKIYVEILGKENIGQIYNKANLQVEFAVKGEQVDLDDIRFECKRETDQAFRRCPAGEMYDFNQLLDGSSYSLAVRAFHRPTKSQAEADSISFTVQFPKLEVTNEDILKDSAKQGQAGGSVQLTFERNAPLGAASIQCALDQALLEDCTSGYNVPINSLESGSHKLQIEAKDGTGGVLASKIINFCIGSCDGSAPPTPGGTPNPATPIIDSFLVGSFYEFQIPQGMHVTEYATSKTYNRQLSFFRVTHESDSHYIGNYACDGRFDRLIEAGAHNDAATYKYCHTTPPDNLYKWLTDYRLANNHLEVATNADLVTDVEHERISINVFDADYEYMRGRSRFEYLCMNSQIQKVPHPIRMFQDFWYTDKVRVEFWMCATDLAGTGFGFPSREKWFVGAFFVANDGGAYEMPIMSCSYQECPNTHPNLLEVTYMARPNPFKNATPAEFARSAQMMFLPHLREVVPN